MIITIHQSQYLPWLPYFDKVLRSNLFIILDDVQFQKNGVQNRNQIKAPNGATWLTVPVRQKFGHLISEVEIADSKFVNKHLNALKTSYGKAPFFKELFEDFSSIYNLKEWRFLNQLNFSLIEFILKKLDVPVEIVKSSNFKTEGKGSDLILSICKYFGAETYISGQAGNNYLNQLDFKRNNIKLIFQNYKYPVYKQLFMKNLGFITDLSVIDLLFNDLENSKEIILSGGKFYEA